MTLALNSSAPVPHFAVLLANYLGLGMFGFVENSLLTLGASSSVNRAEMNCPDFYMHNSDQSFINRHLLHLSQ